MNTCPYIYVYIYVFIYMYMYIYIYEYIYISGIKKPPVGSILENKSYMFFSHVIKAQQANLDVLDKLLTSNVSY
jgi:hypothetical protein